MPTPPPVQAVESASYGRPVPSRLKAVALRGGVAPEVRWGIVDDRGCAVDLSPYVADGCTVQLRVVEYSFTNPDPDFPGRVVDAEAGTVGATVDPVALGGPGIFAAEFGVLAADGTPLLTNPFLLVVERGLFGGADPTGMPTRAEVRLHLRDDPQSNELIGDFAWDDAEIFAALQAPIDYWNAALPDVGSYHTTQTFPARYRYWWLRGATAMLFRTASEAQRRNQFDYAAGGVQVQDSNRSQEYNQAADAAWQEFTAWVRQRKIALNIELGWGSC